MKSLLGLTMTALGLALASPAAADQLTGTGAGVAYPPGGGIQSTSTINIPQTGSVTKVVVTITKHSDYTTYGSSTTYVLTHNGKAVKIFDKRCAAKYNVNMQITDSSTRTFNSLYYSTKPPCPQSPSSNPEVFQPANPLSAFNGLDASGTWQLQAYTESVNYAMDAESWKIDITTDTPIWNVGAWSPYSSTCGSATRTRAVACQIGSTVVADSQCVAAVGAKPDTTEAPSYQTSGCTYAWNVGTYTPTYAPNSTCGATTQTAPVTCQRSDGQTADDGMCTGTKPTAVKPYTDPNQCVYQWQTGAWVEPTSTCGDGTRTRQVTCRSLSDPAIYQADSKRDPATKPASSEPVSNYTSCMYGWYRSGYSLSACIGGRQTYRAYFSCYRSTGASVASMCGDIPPNRVITMSCANWAQTTIGFGDDYGAIVPGGSLPTAQYSTSGYNVGSGYLSKGTSSSGLTGYGNASSGTGSGGGLQVSGGSYNVDTDVYTDSAGRTYTGGNYNSATGTYDNATLVSDPSNGTGGTGTGNNPNPGDAGRYLVMRRPLPGN